MLSKHQSGFHPGDSCIYQLLAITHDIFFSFDTNHSLETRGEFLVAIRKAFDRGNSKSTFAKDSWVLTPHPLVVFEQSRPQGTFILAGTHPLALNFYTFEIWRKEIDRERYCFRLNSTCLLRSHSGICVKWIPLLHDKSICFTEMSAL